MSPSIEKDIDALHIQSSNELIAAGIEDSIAHAKQDSSIQELDASKLRITKTTTLRKVPEPDSVEVWDVKSCTDHMVKVTWTDTKGWHTPEITPYGPLSLMPTASCLHYATQCFEGMKVYRGFDGKLRLFRPDLNCARLVTSKASDLDLIWKY